MITWLFMDQSMLYPNDGKPIPYVLIESLECTRQIKMILVMSAPKDAEKLAGIRELAELEYCSIAGQWAGELVDLIDRGKLTFDLVFADELIDTRHKMTPS